jgi:hypothetical protein
MHSRNLCQETGTMRPPRAQVRELQRITPGDIATVPRKKIAPTGSPAEGE